VGSFEKKWVIDRSPTAHDLCYSLLAPDQINYDSAAATDHRRDEKKLSVGCSGTPFFLCLLAERAFFFSIEAQNSQALQQNAVENETVLVLPRGVSILCISSKRWPSFSLCDSATGATMCHPSPNTA
jgi:hypothetical protein